MGIWKLLLLLAVVMVVLGPGKLPNALRDIGKSLKSLRHRLQHHNDNESDEAQKMKVVSPDKEE